jgi:hypothetical protein
MCSPKSFNKQEIPMPIVKVSLDTSNSSGTTVRLELKTNPIEIKKKAKPKNKSIHWHLSGNAYSGAFRLQTDAPPGFAWSGATAAKRPPPGTFEDATLSTQKKALTVKDNHKDATTTSSAEGWAYTLSFDVGGVTYQTDKTTTIVQTSPTSGPATITGQDPTIRNN